MKRILTLTALFGLLVSCTPTVVLPPAASVTGYWKGSIDKYAGAVHIEISTHLKVTDSPNPGDFTGTGQIRGTVSADNAVVTGNVNTGELVATNGDITVTCTGTFRNNNEYNGSCSARGYSAQLYMTRVSD